MIDIDVERVLHWYQSPNMEVPVMTDESKTVSVEDLEYYVVLGMSKEGKPVLWQSNGVTLHDMVQMLARAKLSVDIESMKIALESYRREREAAASAIIKPTGLMPQ